MSILEKLAMMSTMDVDPSDDETQSPCFRRLKINRKIDTDMMLLTTYQELNSNFHTSNPSLVKTTSTAAADRKAKLDALKNNIADNEIKSSDKANNKNKKKIQKRKQKKDSVEDFVFPKKTARPASPSISEPIATANSFSDLVEDQNKVTEDKEADIPKSRPPQPIHLKIKENIFRSQIKSIMQKFPDTITKNSGKFVKLYTKDVEFPKPKKGSPLPKFQNLNKNKCKEGVTFANVVSGTNFPPLPTPNATVTKPSEIKNSSKEIHGIYQEDKSDLAQVIEHVNLISNILKKSPEILQILNNLKNADDDNAKTFLLVEALLDKK
ncbi:hypothetical protein TNCV_2897071 [Trichonephila clavipes]|nr:hypothetical protein TNCV_2897071 [Trichonephila clavipes]